ncbi:MAG: hypothetical protein IAF94_25725 [Pirellulaceae bacterium]|nr:hypothetical protein [Pirellulaceae bacterium]
MSREQLDELQSEAWGLEASPAKVAILEQAVQLADSLQDVSEGYNVRQQLIEAATFGGMEDRALVAFSWCLARSDKEPDRFPEDDLLWKYKWILAGVTDYPAIPLEKIRAMEEDFERRLKRNGYGLRSLYKLRMDNANDLGFLQAGKEFEEKWRKARRDGMVDCHACEVDAEVSVCVGNGEYAEAIKKARPIMSGKIGCHTVPQRTYADIIIAELSRGRLEKAAEAYESGYPQVAGNPDFLSTIGWHLCYLTRAADIPRGLRLVERHLPWASQSNNPSERMAFYSRVGTFFERIGQERPKSRKVRIPTALTIHNDEDRYAPADLAAWFQAEAAKLAARFDARNGNGYTSWDLADTRALALGLDRPEYEA